MTDPIQTLKDIRQELSDLRADNARLHDVIIGIQTDYGIRESDLLRHSMRLTAALTQSNRCIEEVKLLCSRWRRRPGLWPDCANEMEAMLMQYAVISEEKSDRR